MYKLVLNHHFDASHKLVLDYESPCQRVHGHRFDVEITIISEKLDKNGMVIDFGKIKNIVNRLDHRHLNEIVDFNPTAENLAKFLHNEIQKLGDFYNVKVVVRESPNAAAEYENKSVRDI